MLQYPTPIIQSQVMIVSQLSACQALTIKMEKDGPPFNQQCQYLCNQSIDFSSCCDKMLSIRLIIKLASHSANLVPYKGNAYDLDGH